MTKIVDDYRDKERRKWNVIVFNVPKSKFADISQRKTEDIEFFNSLVEDVVLLQSILLMLATCLGAKVANKFHPFRVQFNNLSHRRSVLMNAKKLCDSSSRLFKKIINPDLSWKSTQVFLGKKDRLKGAKIRTS